ncbi:ASKHA domain-containing protein [Zhaonella formicivorans]|uniref:ASKHA domain-containing protein n=1 Tax=Zhaonella formicivorans TaxID=2528593 RepID=UPI0010EFF104|nr:ASKHA domain-containing protein [Zhaonella formicivorans]
MEICSVTFLPDNVTVKTEPGITIAGAARLAGIELKMPCGGEGSCGKCVVRLTKKGTTEELLACQTIVYEDIFVEVPQNVRLGEHQILLAETEQNFQTKYDFEPLCQKVAVRLSPPSLYENASDWTRLSCELSKAVGGKEVVPSLPVLQKMAHLLRKSDWHVSALLVAQNGFYELIDLQPGMATETIYGLAIDIGTTTIVIYLVDLVSGKVLGKAGTYNKQAAYGDDIITRIIHCQSPKGLKQLHDAVIDSITELTEQLLATSQVVGSKVYVITVAGNTTMIHLFLGMDPKFIRLDPYIPTAAQFPIVKGKELGLETTPEACVYCLPAVGSYVGGDIVAGVLSTGMNWADNLTLFIDIGTNGEIVLGNKEWLISCACSAGPAFEGSGITCGMRAMQGAIERVEINPVNFEVRYQTIEGTPPAGICGSGLIDCIAKLHRVGLIDRAGRFCELDKPVERLRKTDEGKEFVLAWDWETALGKDITLTEGDIQNLIRAKGAIFAGIQCLLKTVQLDFSSLERIYIAGGFGNYLNIADAIEIGLLPDLPHHLYRFVGNTSVRGAYLSLISQTALNAATEIGKKLTYLELSAGNNFMEEFISALFLPHTNLELFPNVKSTTVVRGGNSD